MLVLSDFKSGDDQWAGDHLGSVSSEGVHILSQLEEDRVPWLEFVVRTDRWTWNTVTRNGKIDWEEEVTLHSGRAYNICIVLDKYM